LWPREGRTGAGRAITRPGHTARRNNPIAVDRAPPAVAANLREFKGRLRGGVRLARCRSLQSHELDRRTSRNALDAVIDVVGVFDGTVHHEIAPGDAHLLARAEEGHGGGARCRVRAAADPVAGDDHGLRAPGVVWGVALGEVD